MRVRFQERVKELFDVEAPNLWNAIKNGILKACERVYKKKKVMVMHGGEMRR